MEYHREVTDFTALVRSLTQADQDWLLQDLGFWQSKLRREDQDDFFEYVFATRQEFRSLMAYRARRLAAETGRTEASEYLQQRMPLQKFVSNLFLSTNDIGPGLYLEHAFSTVVFARRIGMNCHINQNVTIGAAPSGIPEIGDNVEIRAGAIIIGGVHIVHNCRIGAGAVVVDNMPDGSVAVSPKATIITREEKAARKAARNGTKQAGLGAWAAWWRARPSRLNGRAT